MIYKCQNLIWTFHQTKWTQTIAKQTIQAKDTILNIFHFCNELVLFIIMVTIQKLINVCSYTFPTDYGEKNFVWIFISTI